MRYVKTLGLMALATVAMMALAGGASATSLTSPVGTTLGVGAEVKAASSTTQWDGTVNLSCNSSTMAGEVTHAGGSSATVEVSLTSFTFAECGSDTYVTLRPGNLRIHATSGGNGTVTSTGAEITVQLHRVIFFVPITTHCLYKTDNTHVGTFTGSSTTKATATLEIGSAAIPQVATDDACGEDAVLTGSYKFTSPDYLDVD